LRKSPLQRSRDEFLASGARRFATLQPRSLTGKSAVYSHQMFQIDQRLISNVETIIV
jgi:hypothetical protein